jgi:hypothetical protein
MYDSQIIRVIKSRMKWMWNVACKVEMRNAYKIFIRNSEVKRPFRRLRHMWKGNIRMDLREMWWEGTDRSHLSQDSNQWWPLVNTVMNLQVP